MGTKAAMRVTTSRSNKKKTLLQVSMRKQIVTWRREKARALARRLTRGGERRCPYQERAEREGGGRGPTDHRRHLSSMVFFLSLNVSSSNTS